MNERRSGRHPQAATVVVRLLDVAFADIEHILRKGDPQVVRQVAKKLLLLERDPEAGRELRGELIGFRKITVGDRDWRIVWRVTHDEVGRTFVDVAEVWAVGARSDAEVCTEMSSRIAALKEQPSTTPLAEALEALGRATRDLEAHAEPAPDAGALPDWLVHVLVHVVGMPEREVSRLAVDDAEKIWSTYTTRPRPGADGGAGKRS